MKNLMAHKNIGALFIVCLIARLLPFRLPNVEPIMALQIPMGKIYGSTVGFLFGFLNIVCCDIITNTYGIWTLVTAVIYGFLGITSAYVFAGKKTSIKSSIKNSIVSTMLFTVFATLFYDAVSLLIGPLFFGQSYLEAFVGQIPFSVLHVLGNMLFVFFVSPIVEYIIVKSVSSRPVQVTSMPIKRELI